MDEISENIFDEKLDKLLSAESQRIQFLEDVNGQIKHSERVYLRIE